MPKQKVNKDQLILDAMKVFRSKGYFHASVSDLAEACNIEKPHFYYYFKDKETLMREVLLFAHDFVKTYILSKAYNEDFTVEQRIRKMMENSKKHHLEDLGGCIIGNTILETSGQVKGFESVLRQYMEDWVAALTYLLEKKYSESKAEAKARELLNQLQGGMMMMRLYNSPLEFHKATERVITEII